MNKQKFLELLGMKLKGLPQMDIEESLAFYSEMIDDRMEEGLSEEEAVLAIGSADDIAAQIISDTPLAKIAKEKIKARGMTAWEIALLVLGSPIWISLGAAAVAIILSLYVSLWAIIGSLWAVFGALAGGAFGGLAAGIIFICLGKTYSGIAAVAAGLALSGVSILAFFGCKAAGGGALKLTKKIAAWTKGAFIKRGEE